MEFYLVYFNNIIAEEEQLPNIPIIQKLTEEHYLTKESNRQLLESLCMAFPDTFEIGDDYFQGNVQHRIVKIAGTFYMLDDDWEMLGKIDADDVDDEYAVYSSHESAVDAAVKLLKELIELNEITGIFQIIKNLGNDISYYIDSEWFDDYINESNESYIDSIREERSYEPMYDSLYDELLEQYNAKDSDELIDILKKSKPEDDDYNSRYEELLDEQGAEDENSLIQELQYADSDVTFDNRLEEEMHDADCDTEEEFLERLNDRCGDSIEYYIGNFGNESFEKVVTDNNLINAYELASDMVDVDGPENYLASDYEEIELNNDYYAYKR